MRVGVARRGGDCRPERRDRFAEQALRLQHGAEIVVGLDKSGRSAMTCR